MDCTGLNTRNIHDSDNVKGLLKAMKKAEHRRVDRMERDSPMRMDCLTNICDELKTFSKKRRIERACFPLAIATAFCFWSRVNEVLTLMKCYLL